MLGFAHQPAPHIHRWGTVRIRMTLLNVAVLSFILGVLGSVVRYIVQADMFATVDRTLAERAHTAIPRTAPSVPRAEQMAPGSRLAIPRFTLSRRSLNGNGVPSSRRSLKPNLVDSTAEGSLVGPKHVLPPLSPRFIPRTSAGSPGGAHWVEPWDRHSYLRSLDGRSVYSTVMDHGTPTRVLSMPIERRGRIDSVLQLAYPLDGVLRDINALTSMLLALAPFGLLAAGLGGAFLADRTLRPVREIAKTAARLGASDLSERLPVSGYDELSELSSSFNAMLARLEEAFYRQRKFTADASHELRTPLSIIKANTSLALEHDWTNDRYREFLTSIDTAASRQSRIVEELLFLARADAGRLACDVGAVCLLEVLEEAVEAVSRPDRSCIRLEPIAPTLMVQGSGSELTRLFINLLENATRHTSPTGAITVSARVETTSVTVTVADTGEGIAPEHLPHLGERFYRVDAARTSGMGGTGLGLAICRSIIDAHGGRMIIESKLGEGTVVRIQLPFCPP